MIWRGEATLCKKMVCGEALRRAEELGLPFSGPLLTLEGDGALLLERHHGVIEYTNTRVVLAAGLYTLRISGEGTDTDCYGRAGRPPAGPHRHAGAVAGGPLMLLMLRNALRGSVLIEVRGPAPGTVLESVRRTGHRILGRTTCGGRATDGLCDRTRLFSPVPRCPAGPVPRTCNKKTRFTLHCAEADASEGAARLCRPVRRVRMVSVGFHLDDRNFRL